MIHEEAVDAAVKELTAIWSSLPGSDHIIARAMLEAAAPYMLSEAWDDGHAAGVDHGDGLWAPPNPYSQGEL